MAEYTKNQNNWSPYEKALIYGAYMHVIQDLYGHMVLQPSRFGYGFAIDSDSAISKPILDYGEMYYELFTGTHLDSTNWRFVERDLYRARRSDRPNYILPYGGRLDFWLMFNIAGEVARGWQDLDFEPVEKFCEAMNACFRSGVRNLTRERLESYLHGWAILNFLIYGYRKDEDERNVNIGGIMARPYWTPRQICNFWDDIGYENFRLSLLEVLVLNIFARVKFKLAKDFEIPMPYDFLRGLPSEPQEIAEKVLRFFNKFSA